MEEKTTLVEAGNGFNIKTGGGGDPTSGESLGDGLMQGENGSDISPSEAEKCMGTESEASDRGCAAGSTKNPEIPITGALEGDLHAEFEELINGRFKEIYQKKVSSIVRKRLKKSVEPSTVISDEGEDGKPETEVGKLPSDSEKSSPQNGKSPLFDSELYKKLDEERQRNQNRPCENGLASGGGVVKRLNVAALSGREVNALLKRAAMGEKISFI